MVKKFNDFTNESLFLFKIPKKYRDIYRKIKKAFSRNADVEFIPNHKEWANSDPEPIIVVIGKRFSFINLMLRKDYKFYRNNHVAKFDGEYMFTFYLERGNGTNEIDEWLNDETKPYITDVVDLTDTGG